VDDLDIEWAELSVRYKVAIARPAVISYFEIESRGRVVSLAPIQLQGDGTMQVNFISQENAG